MAVISQEQQEETEAGNRVEEKGAGQAIAEEPQEKQKGKSDPWRLEPQPIRETEVGNAVKFLSNPKVRSSPIVHRRSFLERKGLTREEIDEAFRRVPDPPSSDHAGTTLPSSGIQAQASTPQAVVPLQQQQQQQAAGVVGKSVQAVGPKGATSWGQRLLAAGFLAAAGACTGVVTKAYLIPKFKEWVRSIVADQGNIDTKPSISTKEPQASEAATAAATAAAAAASEVAAAIRDLAHARAKEGQQLSSIIKALETQTQELKSALAGMKDVVHGSDTISHLRSHRTDVWRTPEMPRPTGMLTDRTFAAVVNSSPAPPEQIDVQKEE